MPSKPHVPKAPRLTLEETVRYGRHLVLPEVGVDGQRRLKESSVLVVGVGGLGNPAATYLASAGVGKIGLLDNDSVEASNLQRQFLFSESDLGKNKASVAKSRLHLVNPNVEVEAIQTRLTSSNALGIIRNFDLVIDATDNLPSRYLINDSCVFLSKPDVYASALRFDGQASVFDARKGPCYRCVYPQPPPPESVESCEEAGVMGVVPGMMGGVQALQAINILLGRGSPLYGRLLVFSGLDSTFDILRIKKDPLCPVCSETPTITKLVDYEEFCAGRTTASVPEIGPSELSRKLDTGYDPLLIDVREPFEYEICHLRNSKLVPLGQLRQRLQELERDRPMVVYCHHGNRSATAVRLLRQEGFAKAVNLKGGIEAWRKLIDPRMHAY